MWSFFGLFVSAYNLCWAVWKKDHRGLVRRSVFSKVHTMSLCDTSWVLVECCYFVWELCEWIFSSVVPRSSTLDIVAVVKHSNCQMFVKSKRDREEEKYGSATSSTIVSFHRGCSEVDICMFYDSYLVRETWKSLRKLSNGEEITRGKREICHHVAIAVT